MDESSTPVVVASSIARGVGNSVLGPLLGATLDAPEVRAAVLRSALVLSGAIALGMVVGFVVGRGVSR